MSVLRLLPALEAKGIQSAVSILRGSGPMVERFEAEGIRVHSLSAERGLWQAWSRFVDTIEQEAPDIIHAYGFTMSLLARFAAGRLHPRPVVVQGVRGLHLTDDPDAEGRQARVARVLERFFGSRVDLYLANSDSAVDFLAGRGMPREKFRVVHNGIDLTHWPAVAHPRACRVLCVAGLRPVKRIGHLLDALAVLRERNVPFRCDLAGDGTLRPSLEQQAAALGLAGCVFFHGRVDTEGVRALLAACRVLVLPSISEGMPVSIMEAMASGVPVVACAVPGVRELVVHGETGLLVAPHDTSSLASAIESLLADPERATRLGASGRDRIARHFAFHDHVEAHTAIYESMAARRIAHTAAGRLENARR